MDTPLLLETVRIENGKAFNLEWHNRRLNTSRRELFGASNKLDIKEYLRNLPSHGIWRARVLYRLDIEKIEILPYALRLPRRFALAEFKGEYRYKYANRTLFEKLKATYPLADELLLCRNGALSDTTIANIALFKQGCWFTPERPLLNGTTRERLLAQRRVVPAHIPCKSLEEFEALAVMNAMTGFRVLKSWQII